MKYRLWSESIFSVPTVYIHSFQGEGEDVWLAAHKLGCKPFNLVSIYDFSGDDDLTPWSAENVWKGQPPFGGRAADHLKWMCEVLIPEIERLLPAPSTYNCLVGYSLAGLFSLWSSFQTDVFSRIACVSASFWYPEFLDFLYAAGRDDSLKALYLSLGDKESKTKHPLMKQIEEKTQEVYEYFNARNIPVIFEMNPGNHFKDSDLRTAKAIRWLLERD